MDGLGEVSSPSSCHSLVRCTMNKTLVYTNQLSKDPNHMVMVIVSVWDSIHHLLMRFSAHLTNPCVPSPLFSFKLVVIQWEHFVATPMGWNSIFSCMVLLIGLPWYHVENGFILAEGNAPSSYMCHVIHLFLLWNLCWSIWRSILDVLPLWDEHRAQG